MSQASQAHLKLLDDLDDLSTPSPSTSTATPPSTSTGPKENQGDVLAFLDDMAKDTPKPKLMVPSPARPASRATERVSLSSLKAKNAEAATPPPPPQEAPSDRGASSTAAWGWGSVWSSASTAIQQAKAVVDDGVKHLPAVPQTEQWREGLVDYVKSAQLDRIGQDLKTKSLSTLTDILNVVAPPIADHEIIQVWLSHDLEGYDGVETLVYRAFTRILEQVEGGDLTVTRGNEARPRDGSSTKRDLNSVEGFDAAYQLAKTSLATLQPPVSGSTPKSSSEAAPTRSTVLLRIQPYTSVSPFPNTTLPAISAADSSAEKPRPTEVPQVQFLLYLSDSAHSIESSAITQSIPATWMDLWDKHEWVEDHLAEVLRLGVETLAQAYIVERMSWLGSDQNDDPEDFEKVEASAD